MASTDRKETGLLPKGRMSVNAIGPEYAIKLDKLARKWGCETLSEAAMEVLKDAVDEELGQ